MYHDDVYLSGNLIWRTKMRAELNILNCLISKILRPVKMQQRNISSEFIVSEMLNTEFKIQR